jgi:small subunit ribosomal protein S13
MARIAGVDLPRNKHVYIALTYIYGIGNPRSARILDEAKVDPMKKVQDLGEDEVNRIRQVIEGEGMVEGDLRKDVQMNIKRLIEIGSRISASPQPARSRAADAHQRAHSQGAAQGNRRD